MHAVEKISMSLEQEVVASEMLPMAVGMATDTVPNIRFNVPKTLENLCSKCGSDVVAESIVPDAPPHAIDLKTADQLFTPAADSEADMISWAVAVQSLIRNKKGSGKGGSGRRGSVPGGGGGGGVSVWRADG